MGYFRYVIATLLVLIAVGCGKAPAPEAVVHHYKLHGVVVRVDPSARTAAIRHGDILDESGKVWMEAMTMDFPVRDPQEFAKLKPDETVDARVNQKAGDLDFWIDQIVAGAQGERR